MKNQYELNNPFFNEALQDGVYSKAKFKAIILDLIGPEILSDSDETVLDFMVQEFNDSSRSNISLLDVVNYLQKNSSKASNKALLLKIHTNESLSKEVKNFQELKRKENRKWYIGFVACAVLGLIYTLNSFGLIKAPTFNTGGKVVVISVDKLAASAASEAISRKLTGLQAKQFSDDYRNGLQKEISRYTDKGYVIINKTSIYSANESQDITNDLLEKLGFKPVDIDMFSDEYSNAQKFDILTNFANRNVGEAYSRARDDYMINANNKMEERLNKEELYLNSQGQSIDLE